MLRSESGQTGSRGVNQARAVSDPLPPFSTCKRTLVRKGRENNRGVSIGYNMDRTPEMDDSRGTDPRKTTASAFVSLA